ncbi:MAG: ThiF family adenylyltransferase [Gemmatimonadota bacterium]
MERYARQQAIAGWDQERLRRASLAVAGHGPTAFLSALMASAMGFGRVSLVGEPAGPAVRESGLRGLIAGPVSRWAVLCRRVNPDVEVTAHPVPPGPKSLERLSGIDVLLVASCPAPADEACTQWAKDAGVVALAGGTAGPVAFWGAPRPDALPAALRGRGEMPLVAQLVAGLLVEEARRAVMPLTGEPAGPPAHHLLALPLLPGSPAAGRPRPLGADRDCLEVIGAGALGTWFGVALGLSGFAGQLRLFDPDTVDTTNLNRQILFFGSVGRYKAPVLAARLRRLFPGLRANGYGLRLDDEVSDLLGDGLLVACPDSFGARAFADRLARRRRRPLISGGTSAHGGSCLTYAPGRTPCLRCVMDIERLAEREAEPQACARVAEASVVTANAITGALMAWAAQELRHGRVRAGVWTYDGRAGSRKLGVHSVRPACRCHLAARGAA